MTDPAPNDNATKMERIVSFNLFFPHVLRREPTCAINPSLFRLALG